MKTRAENGRRGMTPSAALQGVASRARHRGGCLVERRGDRKRDYTKSSSDAAPQLAELAKAPLGRPHQQAHRLALVWRRDVHSASMAIG
eukprot:138963-Pyramimonas_sp.AAC.2